MFSKRRLWIVFGTGAACLGVAVTWFVNDFLYDLLWESLEEHNIKHAKVVAFALSHILPFTLAILIVATVYLIVKREYAQKTPLISPPTESNTVEARPSEEPTYMTAYEVLHYMVDDSEWGWLVKTVPTVRGLLQNPLHATPDEFKARAQDGQVACLGRLYGDGPHVRIPPEHWFNSIIDLPSAIEGPISRTIPSVSNHGRIPTYTDLKIVRADVYRTWPPHND